MVVLVYFSLFDCLFYSKYGGPYDYSSYNNRMGDAVRHPVAQKKHHMFGKRFFQDQSNVQTMPLQAANNTVLPQPDIPIKYEYEPYGMHHSSIGNTNLEGATGGAPITNKHQVQPQQQQHPLSQAEMKYSCSLDFARQNNGRTVNDLVGHNHTYTLPQGTGATPRPQARDKKNPKKQEDEHLSRDEKRARALNVSFSEIS